MLHRARLRLSALGLVLITVAGAVVVTTTPAGAATGSRRPNIVLVLTDDLDGTSYFDAQRFPVFHHLMVEQGMTFSDYFVTDSLCCPSRASLLRGQYVHDTDVLGNLPPSGGFERFHQLGEESSTVATWLQESGYRTGLFGKYLNGYPATATPTYVPAGWDEWVSPSAGNPYAEYGYQLNENGKLVDHGSAPSDYLVDVLSDRTTSFIRAASHGHQPFFAYVAPYVPHQPATPAPRHVDAFPNVHAPRTASFDQVDPSAPAWLRDRPALTPAVVRYIDALYRRRLQSMLGVEDMLSAIVHTLKSTGQLDNTYIVFTSDNGFHLGQHRLPPGKQTAFDEDIHVPLVVRGPGVKAHSRSDSFVMNIDMAPTFAALGHAHVPHFADGASFADVLHGKGPAHARKDALIEHYQRPGTRAGRKDVDDDANPPVEGLPTSGPTAPLRRPRRLGAVAIPDYTALRTDRYVYVEYGTGERELYDLRRDPDEIHNVAATASPALIARLSKRLAELRSCSGATCRA